jgi:hypothetical protein
MPTDTVTKMGFHARQLIDYIVVGQSHARWRSEVTKTLLRERDIKREIRKLTDAHGWFTWVTPSNGFGKSGVSDRLCLRDSVFMAVEAKRDSPLSIPQRDYLINIHNQGGLAFVVDHVRLPHFEAFLDAFDRAQRSVIEGHKPAPEDGSIMLNATAEMHKEFFDKLKGG